MDDALAKAKSGFESLDIDQEYVDQALHWLEIWLTDSAFADYQPQIHHLIENEQWDFLLDSFYQVIPFGTGGRRGPVGIGPNRINVWTIQASAQGHAQYLIKQYGDEAKKRGVVLCEDVRTFTEEPVYNHDLPNPVRGLNSTKLAHVAAEVYAANGIKVYLFDGVRTTPELSFAVRYKNAIAGDVFSASHNPPNDNGKKVYDEHGGQLIPPYDQQLVDEVTNNVNEIKKIPFETAKELIEVMRSDVDDAYVKELTALSLSHARNLKVLYSPLHGTGKTSCYRALKELKFDLVLDPKTENESGAFESITFNIPNPEVQESFDTMRDYGREINADVLLNSDPDADRMGVIALHHDAWSYLNGNEIGILLTDYGISKKSLNENSIVVKTDVTTSLITKLAKDNNVNVIGDLLVGFKYIGNVMNTLEQEGKIGDFIIGAEESHGFIMGNYCRDKDGAAGAVWICELAAELKEQGKTLVDKLQEIYQKHGYCHNYLTEIRMLGATGRNKILQIMDHLRKNDVRTFEHYVVSEKVDRWDGPDHVSETDTASRNLLVFHFENPNETQSIKVTVRPSGTEPKIKMYFEVFGNPGVDQETIVNLRKDLEKTFMTFCYEIIGIDFPERGFLLFWQLPLNDKLHYFEIEEEIASLEGEHKAERLEELLRFLGSDPIQKIDPAFKARYGKGIKEHLGL